MVERYDSKCPVGRTMNVIGDTWSVMILRDLFLNTRCRYQDFVESLAYVSPNTLSERLKWLEAQGVVKREYYSEHPPRAEYVLTEKGKALGPIVKAMKEWGEKF